MTRTEDTGMRHRWMTAGVAAFVSLGVAAHAQRDAGLVGAGDASHAAVAAARMSVARLLDSLAMLPALRNAQWGALIVDVASGDTLGAVNADRLFVPASNQKLVTAAAALATLGPGFRFTTRLATHAPIRDGTLEGDLVVIGSGDPSFSNRMRDGDAMAPLRGLADSLRARGVLRIDGALRRGPSPFTDAPIGLGWAWDDLGAAYAAPVGDLMYNESLGTVRVAIEGIRDSTATRRADQLHFLEAFYAALQERGISVRSAFDWNTVVPDSGLVPLAVLGSPPLDTILRYFQKESQNQIGEILLKTMGRVVTGHGRADSGAAVVARQLRAWGVDTTGFVVRDGSGLSRHNWISPAALVHVLRVMRSSSSFATFRDALPVAGVDGTLERRMRGNSATGNVRAKTGSMDRVRALAGYASAQGGRELAFAVLINGYTAPARDIEAILDHIATHLTTLTLAR